jgi:hypothetical protein
MTVQYGDLQALIGQQQVELLLQNGCNNSPDDAQEKVAPEPPYAMTEKLSVLIRSTLPDIEPFDQRVHSLKFT